VHGPHDDRFYKFLAGLEQEYDDLQRSGYAGEGFFGPGQRLGEGVSWHDRDIPLHVAKQKALEAAERRAKRSLLDSGAHVLGGKWTTKILMKSPRELAFEVGRTSFPRSLC
jgi:hypothetical protein